MNSITRRWFPLGILAAFAAKAQDSKTIRVSTIEPNSVWPKKNGECPLCGTQAPPFKPDLEEWKKTHGPCGPAPRDPVTGGVYAVCISWGKDDLPKTQTVICSRCKVHFEQNAE